MEPLSSGNAPLVASGPGTARAIESLRFKSWARKFIHKGDISPMATELLSSSSVVRDPISDHVITPQNSAMVVIDYQPAQVGAVSSWRRWTRTGSGIG